MIYKALCKHKLKSKQKERNENRDELRRLGLVSGSRSISFTCRVNLVVNLS